MTETGTVIEALPGCSFRVKSDKDGKEILAYLSGKMRKYRIRVLPGDKVTVEMTPYDDKRGRVVRRI